VQRYVPEFERRWARFARPINSSWRVDETSVPVQGRWTYLYRAVDRNGKSVHSMLSESRTIESAQEFFRQAVRATGSWPEKINLDGNMASHRGLRLLGKEDSRWNAVAVRARRYLNNIIEQGHRVIKRRLASILALKSFRTAAVTFSGIELAHRIHKHQFALAYERDGRALSLKQLWDQALSSTTEPGVMEQTPPPLTHHNSIPRPHPLVNRRRSRRLFVRYARKVSFGGGLHLLVSPTGGRYWRYRYRFEGRENLISLGLYPEVPIESAQARHHAARQLLALGVNPADRRKALRRISAERI
jgi:transposase-like protein